MSFWIQYPDLIFEEDKHIFRWRGEKRNGVTSLYDRIATRKWDEEKNDWGYWAPIGIPDFCKSKEASNWGSSFHKIAGIILKGGTVNIADPEKAAEAQPYIDGFYNFLEDEKIQPLFDENGNQINEYPLYSERHGFAGIPDFFCLDKQNRFLLPDWKTSADNCRTYGPQTAAYETLIREVFGNRPLFTVENEPVFIKSNSKIIRMPVLFGPKFKKGYEKQKVKDGDWNTYLSLYNTLKFAA